MPKTYRVGEPELKDFFPSDGDYYDYFSFQSAQSVEKALDDMTEFLKLEGPYDGLIAFSLGGALAATWLLRQAQLYPNVPLPVKCAVFLSAGAAVDLASLQRGEVALQTVDDLYLRGFPTAHIWGRNDELWADRSERLCGMCDPQDRVVFLHEEGHSVPGTRAKEALLGCVRAIRRTVGRASMAA
jgi:hypothetical protein